MESQADGGPRDGQADGAASRRAARAHRQARVGILPNPNRAPTPPPRRPPLIGRWVALRSSRRPPPRPAEPEPPPAMAAADGPTVRTDPSGAILQIDIRRLDAVADALTPRQPSGRPGYAQQILSAPPPVPPQPPAAMPPPPAPDPDGDGDGDAGAADPPVPGLRSRLIGWLRRRGG